MDILPNNLTLLPVLVSLGLLAYVTIPTRTTNKIVDEINRQAKTHELMWELKIVRHASLFHIQRSDVAGFVTAMFNFDDESFVWVSIDPRWSSISLAERMLVAQEYARIHMETDRVVKHVVTLYRPFEPQGEQLWVPEPSPLTSTMNSISTMPKPAMEAER